ncbi:galactosylgalactosylxylosylprotein 3-beta-glucuronosyltransferase 1-like [Mizuhopecten yessoensis]|uniref:Galactosylgalactosylxylosylprotein 3-beta-glucuronosyltransferase n=1 Tax=Mizuhopecten yessoensis TaxID=6573 RepID=A0A210QXV7_MIZYE|nr:galactosylgalactosylxylosylprotein 3-beta-glucuronosyltransferase 1-like [Mizuhopecten yessoensis]OWF53552.1 Galactosylgalactosylxylosylprotein 3-beta-glucuronosyltransferase 2 [Mizuhopecten yessoensis]
MMKQVISKYQVSMKLVRLKKLFICCVIAMMGLTIIFMIKVTRVWVHQVQYVSPVIPTIYVITPTYYRLEQKADLTRMSNTLLHVHHLHWIVVEDSVEKTKLVTYFLETCGVINTHLNISTPREKRLRGTELPRGVLQRNAGLDWIRTNLDPEVDEGVVYFADDDNTYNRKLFEEMRYTQRVSVWPVGLVGGLKHESPIVKNGKVKGWNAMYMPERNFAIDMAGFGVNINIILNHTKTKFSYSMLPGTLETSFLTALGTKIQDLEPRADGCTKVLVWHTRTEKTKIEKPKDGFLKQYKQEQFADVEV